MSSCLTWWHDDLMIWWHDDMMTWWHDAMMTWWKFLLESKRTFYVWKLSFFVGSPPQNSNIWHDDMMTCWKFLCPCTRTFPLWKLSFLVASPPQIFNSSSRPYQKWSIFGRGDLMNCFQTGTQLTQWSRKRVLILTSWVRTPWRQDFLPVSFTKTDQWSIFKEETGGYQTKYKASNKASDHDQNSGHPADPAGRLPPHHHMPPHLLTLPHTQMHPDWL